MCLSERCCVVIAQKKKKIHTVHKFQRQAHLYACLDIFYDYLLIKRALKKCEIFPIF